MNEIRPQNYPTGPTALRVVDGHQAVLEQAKGALMLRFGIGSYPAFAMLVKWAHDNDTSPQVVAHILVRGICQGEPPSGSLERALLEQLEQQMGELP